MKNRTYRYFTGTPVFPFGHGLSYADIHEQWIDAKTVELTNESEIDTAYAVLRYADAPDRHLIGFEKVFIKAKERKTVVFER
jgi:beta-glucosidase